MELNSALLLHTAQKACGSFTKEQRNGSACQTAGQNLEILLCNNGNGLAHTDGIVKATRLPLLSCDKVAIYTQVWPAETQACKGVPPAGVGWVSGGTLERAALERKLLRYSSEA